MLHFTAGGHRCGWLLLLISLLTNCAQAQPPAKAVVETVLKSLCNCEQAAGQYTPRSTLTLNAVQFGQPYRATAQEVQVEGLPEGTVFPAIINYTNRTYYSGNTHAIRRVREAKVYKDRFGHWMLQETGGGKQDVTTDEPARP